MHGAAASLSSLVSLAEHACRRSSSCKRGLQQRPGAGGRRSMLSTRSNCCARAARGGSRASPVGARFAGPAGSAPRHHTPPLAARALVARPAAAAHTPGSGAGRARTSCCPLLNRRHLHTCPQIHISMKIHTSVYIKYQNVQMFTFKFDTNTHHQQQQHYHWNY